jgi:hypothetical protein
MSHFDEDDVTIDHARLAGGGYLRLTHRPSGLFVDADLNAEPIVRTKNALMNNLREKVLDWTKDCRESRADVSGSRGDLPGERGFETPPCGRLDDAR